MILTIEVEVTDFLSENTYFYIDDETLHGFLIDPGAQAEKLLKIIAEKNFVIEKILLTHGHIDHIGAVNEIQSTLKIPAVMHENGKIYAQNPTKNLSRFIIESDYKLNDVDFLPEGEIIALEKNPDFSLKLIAAPGHTSDGAIFYDEKNNLAFVGDTIFKMGRGRTDFPGGSEKILIETIKTKIFTLPDETVLLCGHGEPTTVAFEKNFFS